MAKKDYYCIQKNLEKLLAGKYTNFLDPSLINKVCKKLKKGEYKIFNPYKECERKILYVNKVPSLEIIEIISYEKLSHREIMGTLYNLNIESEMFGDIVIYDNHYYVIILSNIYDYIKNIKVIGKKNVKIKKVDFSVLDSYERKYEEVKIIVSSLRIDVIISKLIGESRKTIIDKFSNNEIFLNYELCIKYSRTLKENDIFSIRKYGKYVFKGVENVNKKNHYIIKCYKYID